MELLKTILVVLHVLSFGAAFGLVISQFKPAARGEGVMPKGLLHSGWALLITGIALVGMTYAVGGAPNNAKIGAKLLVLLVIMAMIIYYNKREPIKPATLGVLTALLALNVCLALIWH
jgi:hypothetical protein